MHKTPIIKFLEKISKKYGNGQIYQRIFRINDAKDDATKNEQGINKQDQENRILEYKEEEQEEEDAATLLLFGQY